MKAKLLVLWLALSFSSTTTLLAQSTPTGSKAPQTAAPDKEVASITEVLNQIQDALTLAQKDLEKNDLPPLASVDLTLKTVLEKTAGGGINLWIISFGAKRERDETQTVTIHLEPPSPKNPTKVGAESITAVLERTIVIAAEGVKNSGTAAYPLHFSGLTIELEFTVKWEGSAGANKIPVVTPITVDLSGKVDKNATQTLKIVFADKKPDSSGKPGNP